MIANKETASASIGKPKALAVANYFGGLVEWSIAAGLQPVNSGPTTVLGSESLTRRFLAPPSEHANVHQGLIRAAEAARVANSSIRLLVVNRKEIHNDLPQLRGRMHKSRKAVG